MNKPKLVLMVGPPGSGKDTYIQNNLKDYCRISQDDQGKQHLLMFSGSIHMGQNVVVSRMNFDKKQRDRYIKEARENGYDIEIVVLHENYDTCLKRCLQRTGHPTIQNEDSARSALNTFFSKYEKPTEDEADSIQFIYPELKSTISTAIFDLDGTLCNTDHREHLVQQEKKNWKLFFEKLSEDPVNEWCKKILVSLRPSTIITLCSGRPDTYKNETKEWLDKNRIPYDHLFMRSRHDFRQDNITKEIIYDFEIKTRYNNILFILDDRKQVIQMWRSRGEVVLDCAGEKGNF